MLLTSDLPVQQIAQMVGIADPFYFSRVFKKQCGTSPTEYREKFINNPCCFQQASILSENGFTILMASQTKHHVGGIAMKKRKGLLIPTLLLAGMLAGCNQAPAENKSSTTEAAPVSTVKADTPDWPRTFKDSLGKEIVIEKKPEKLASLWYFYPEILVALGEPPAASTEKEYLSSLAYLTGKLDRAEELGDKLSPSIEKILSVEPDLILATEQHEKMYDSLEKVAPVITLKSKDIYDDWQYGLRTLAEIIGKEDEAENVIAKMMKEITAGREALQSLQGESVALILSWDGKTFNVLGEGNPVYTLAFDKEKGLGLTPDGAFQGTAMDTSAITGGPLAIEYALQNISTALRKL